MSIMQMKRGILEGRVADPGGVDQDPDSTFKKIPYPGPDPAVKKKPDPHQDLTFETQPDLNY